jgi:hypothetical protein
MPAEGDDRTGGFLMNARADKRLAALDTFALGQTALVAVLLATQSFPQPQVSIASGLGGSQIAGRPSQRAG